MSLDTTDIKCWQFVSLRRTTCLLLCTVVSFGPPRHNNEQCFLKKFNTCWCERTRSLQFYCNCLPVPYLIDQCRLLFWQKMTISSNRLLLVLSRLCHTQINSIAAKYGMVQHLVNVSCTRIKWRVWNTFAATVLWFYVFVDECVISCLNNTYSVYVVCRWHCCDILQLLWITKMINVFNII